jgi:hypothetical protein
MGIHQIKDKYFVYKGENQSEKKYRTELSKIIISKFGKGYFEQEIIREIVVESLNYYISKFKEICFSENSLLFYQNVFKLHEQATELVYKHADEKLEGEIDFKYIASYRRILKFILETGCEVQMQSGEIANQSFKIRLENKLNDLLFLGEMIFTCVSLYAEQSMVEDVAEVEFNENDEYIFSRRHHYEFIFQHIIEEFGSHLTKTVVDETEFAGFTDLTNAIENCFGIKYKDVGHIIASIHEQNKIQGGDVAGVGWETLTFNLNKIYNIPLEIAEQFFQGLRLDKTNKMDLLDLACKPYNLNRYIYKPIIIWTIDGNDYALFGKNSWSETFIQYSSNAIPWGKAPKEWLKNKCFKTYVHTKEDAHDKWLDDDVEVKLINNENLYDRNVKRIYHNNGSENIDIKDLGEIDFIIISKKTETIYIADCKHLLGRYDIVNQKNDFNAFSVGAKSYNSTIDRKVNWFIENKELLNQHFVKKYNDLNLKINDYRVEGIFIINTPTFYMYNSTFRIYTTSQIIEVLNGTYIDKTFMILNEEESHSKFLNITYPYFQKPKYLKFDPFSEETEK